MIFRSVLPLIMSLRAVGVSGCACVRLRSRPQRGLTNVPTGFSGISCRARWWEDNCPDGYVGTGEGPLPAPDGPRAFIGGRRDGTPSIWPACSASWESSLPNVVPAVTVSPPGCRRIRRGSGSIGKATSHLSRCDPLGTRTTETLFIFLSEGAQVLPGEGRIDRILAGPVPTVPGGERQRLMDFVAGRRVWARVKDPQRALLPLCPCKKIRVMQRHVAGGDV